VRTATDHARKSISTARALFVLCSCAEMYVFTEEEERRSGRLRPARGGAAQDEAAGPGPQGWARVRTRRTALVVCATGAQAYRKHAESARETVLMNRLDRECVDFAR
jgi:hypothetical protein